MQKVCIIGNNASNRPISDGGRIKIRLYNDCLHQCKIDSFIIDLDGWKKHPLKIYHTIKRAIKENNTILIMAGPKGCRLVIPLVNHLNKRKSSRVVFCPLGIGTLDWVIRKLSIIDAQTFLQNNNYFHLKDNYMKKQLSKIDYVIPQNSILVECYRKYYGLDNVRLLNNFRLDTDFNFKYDDFKHDKVKIIYCSRINRNKGIFDLMTAVKNVNSVHDNVSLDIYGDLQLSNDDSAKFYELLDSHIMYKGVLKRERIEDVFKQHNVFCLPTRYYGEGTSGSVIEALICGLPIIISNYSQASLVVEDRKNGLIFEFCNEKDLENKLLWLEDNLRLLDEMHKNALESGKKYLFSKNKECFVKYVIDD